MNTPINVPQAAPSVPDDLLADLHDATDRLHKSKEHLEKESDAYEYRHQERVDQAADEFRKAERELEEVNAQIKKSLHEAAEQ